MATYSKCIFCPLMLGGKHYTALNLKLTEREELYLFKVKAKQIYSVAIIIHLSV